MLAIGTSNTVTKGDGNSRPVGSKRRDSRRPVRPRTCPKSPKKKSSQRFVYLRSACTYTQMHAHATCMSTDNLHSVTVQSRSPNYQYMPSKKVSAYLSEQYVRIAILPFLELTHCSCVVSKPVTTQVFFYTRCQWNVYLRHACAQQEHQTQ